ncbi:MAG: hypothetical protein WDN31_18480 [Hyphomicrobium sp.]
MTELLWQAWLLLLAAFFVGAVLACGLKRRFYYGPPSKKVRYCGERHPARAGRDRAKDRGRAARRHRG